MRPCCPRPSPRRPGPGVEPLERRRLLSTTYYVSPTGLDTNPGTSAAEPLQTLAAVDKLVLQAGDAVLLAGGATFAGTITLTAADAGTAADPITISSYGTGRAEIDAGGGDGIDVLDTSGIAISNLNIEGSGASSNDTSVGINLFNDRTTGGRLGNGVSITEVDVGGFGLYGIGIGAATVTNGFDGVSVTHATLHDDDEAGLQSYAGDYTANPAPYGLAHAGIYVAYVSAYDNAGNTIHLDSGNGILLGDVADSTVEHCVAHDNGLNHDGGPCGIWTYNSDHVTIQYNASYGNAGGKTDGDGFDLDGGTTNAVLQYNYSQENTGAGILLCQFADATAWSGNVVRYNISQDDGRAHGYGAIDLYTPAGSLPLADSQVYGNTVYVSDADGSAPSGLVVRGETQDFGVYNNVFDVAADLSPIVVAEAGTGLTLAGNDYWAGSSSDANLDWLGTTYQTLDAWRTATGEEQLGGTDTGLSASPALADAGGGTAPSNADDLAAGLTAYQLTSTSPLINAGVSLPGRGIDPGPTDFFGVSVPQGSGFDIGAAEWVATVSVVGPPGNQTPSATPTPTPTASPLAAAVAVTTSAVAPVAEGAAVTLTATVSAATATGVVPTGSVTFALADGTALGTATLGADDTAALATSSLPVGVDEVSASYGGDATFAGATTAAGVAVTVNPPALSPTAVRTTVPATVVAAAARVHGKVTVTVINTSAATESGRAKVELFAAPAGVLDGTAVAVGSAMRRVLLKVGRSATLSVPVTSLPSALGAGTYRWIARVDDASGLRSISPAGPALTVAAATVTLSATARAPRQPATVVTGSRVGGSVFVSVTNSGNTASTSPLSVTLYLSADGVVDGAAVPVGTVERHASVRPAGLAVTLTVVFGPVPSTVPAGTYTLLAVVTDGAGHTAVTALSAALTVTGA